MVSIAEPGRAQPWRAPPHLLPTLALASSFYPPTPPSSLYLFLLLNKLNLVSMLFSCPPESTSITPTEILALTDTPNLVTHSPALSSPTEHCGPCTPSTRHCHSVTVSLLHVGTYHAISHREPSAASERCALVPTQPSH